MIFSNLSKTVGSIPPLPDPIPFPPTPPEPVEELPVTKPIAKYERPDLFPSPFPWRTLRCGCYIIKVVSSYNHLSVADGTLRVECHGKGRIASGDLYLRKIFYFGKPHLTKPSKVAVAWSPRYRNFRPLLESDPDPSQGIPIFPRNQYRYYIKVTKILESFTKSNSFELEFELYLFSKKSWTLEGVYTAQMFWTTAPVGYPSKGDYLEGDVKNSSGKVVARLSMGWVSNYLRKATVEIDRVAESESPLNNGAGIDWRTIFDQVGWDVTVVASDTDVTEPSGESWSEAECHNEMLNWRDSNDLDNEWRYYLLCVRRLDSTNRGFMFDVSGTDSNNVPREGAAISSHWQFTNDPFHPDIYNTPWGLCSNLRFGQCTRAYFRTAVHEIAHAMVLYHPSDTTWGSSASNNIMQVTPQIASNAVAPVQFPNNIEWSFLPENQNLLRHLPDVIVRPGSVIGFYDPFSSYTGIPINQDDMFIQPTGIELQVKSLLESVPIGAPVRIGIKLVNAGIEAFPVPADISMKSGHITGKVVDPSGTERNFSTIIKILDSAELQLLEPNQSIDNAVTLLRGPKGALFPLPGLYNIVINLSWEGNRCRLQVSGETKVMVISALNEKHAKTARRILSTPDTLLTLVFGGDHIKEGINAIHDAIEDSVLRDHFTYIEAKRLAQRYGKRKADPDAFAKLITNSTVMSAAEIKKAAKLLKSIPVKNPARKKISTVLKHKIRKIAVNNALKEMIEKL